jgi:MFS family permease
MRERIKWVLVGFGLTALLQLLVSLAFTGLAFSAARGGPGAEPGTISTYLFGFTLGAFLVGGFVIGWLSEQVRVVDAVIVALLTLAVSAVIYTLLPSEAARAQFATGTWLSDTVVRTNADGTSSTVTHIAFTSRSALFALLALVASSIGAYWGWHVRVPHEGWIDRVALLIGLIGAVVGPFVMLATAGRGSGDSNSPGLPGYFLASVLVLLLIIVGVGYAMFQRESRDDEISISPEHHKQENVPREALTD